MNLNPLFPAHEIIRSPAANVPAVWAHLLTVPRAAALCSIADCLGLTEASQMRGDILGAADLGIAAPRRRRDRRDTRLWTLAILHAPFRTMLFGCPVDAFLASDVVLPEPYTRIIRNLGNLRFERYSGQLMWPASIEKAASDIDLAMATSASPSPLVPFYDHKTGDFDCWLGKEYDTVYVYSHESHGYEEYSAGGFVSWMEKRYQEDVAR